MRLLSLITLAKCLGSSPSSARCWRSPIGLAHSTLSKATKLLDFLPPPDRLAILKIYDFGFVVFCSARFLLPVHSVPELNVFSLIVVCQSLLPEASKAFKRVIYPWHLIRRCRHFLQGYDCIDTENDGFFHCLCFLFTSNFVLYKDSDVDFFQV